MGGGLARGAFVAVAAWAACWAGAAPAAAAGPTSAPTDPAFHAGEQWGLAQAGFPSAWCRSQGAGALIVVIDTGVSAAHPDLAGKLAGEAAVHNGAITTGPGAAADDAGHGTHVAGIAAADTDNGVGIAGAAPLAKVYAIKALWASGSSGDGAQAEQGTRADLVQAIDYATNVVAPAWPGPVVLNVSIGAADAPGTSSGSLPADGADVDAAITRAADAGLGVAVAAGNTGTTGLGSGAVAAGAALAVGALDEAGSVAPYSPSSGVSIFAAGGSAGAGGRYTGTGILSTWLHTASGDYAWMAGTSMAAPHVAAALALLMSTGMDNRDAYARLLDSEDAQRRMHVDSALGAAGAACGTAAAAGGTSASQAVRATVVAPAPARPLATPAAAAPTAAVASPAAALPVTGAPTAPTAAALPSGGHPWLTRGALGLGGLVLLWMALPRRLRRALGA